MSAIQPLSGKKKCVRCKGVGYTMGLGGIRKNCNCDELKKPEIKLDKRSKEFKKAVKEMKETNPEMSEEKAVELLEAALRK